MNVQNYDPRVNEMPFLDNGVRCRLVASALTSTGTGKAVVNFLVRVSDNQDALDSTTRTKAPMGGKLGLFQQSFSTEGAAAITINTLRTFGWKGEDLAEINKAPEENGMTEEVAISSENDTYGGKSRVRVKFVNKADLSMKSEGIAELNSLFGKLIHDSKKGPLQVKKAAAPAGSGSVQPPARDTSGTATGADGQTGDDDVPF